MMAKTQDATQEKWDRVYSDVKEATKNGGTTLPSNPDKYQGLVKPSGSKG
jgi:hypothetical protein